jgi:hypothetical protein
MWDQPNALVMTDCGAVNNLRGAPVNAPSDEAAAAYAINNGTDIEAGSTLLCVSCVDVWVVHAVVFSHTLCEQHQQLGHSCGSKPDHN